MCIRDSHWSLRLIGAVIGVVLGLALAIPGVQLIMLGGSWYYVVAGLAGVVALSLIHI